MPLVPQSGILKKKTFSCYWKKASFRQMFAKLNSNFSSFHTLQPDGSFSLQLSPARKLFGRLERPPRHAYKHAYIHTLRKSWSGPSTNCTSKKTFLLSFSVVQMLEHARRTKKVSESDARGHFLLFSSERPSLSRTLSIVRGKCTFY